MRGKEQDLYRHITDPLAERGLDCTVEYGLSDWIVVAEMHDGSQLVISPPQEPYVPHPPGYPHAWLVSHNRDTPNLHRVVYDSLPNGPDAAHEGDTTHLLRALDEYLDRLGVPPRRTSAARAASPTAHSRLTRATAPTTPTTAPSTPPPASVRRPR